MRLFFSALVLFSAAGIGGCAARGGGGTGPPSLTSTRWQLRSWGGPEEPDSTLAGARVTARFVFDSQDRGRVFGSGGCNRYSASFELSGEVLEVGAVTSTRKMCRQPAGVMRQEARYLQALGSARRLLLSGYSLRLFYPAGELLFEAVP